MDILFCGAGKMATAIAAGALSKGLFPPESLSAFDPSPLAREAFTAATGIPVLPQATPEAMAKADVLILAVKPQSAQDAFSALPPRKPGSLVLSICAGLSLARLRQWFGDARMVRVMPNTPLMAGAGASCYALSRPDDREADAFAARLLGAMGKAWRVPEEQLDAVTALSGSGPAFFAFMEQAMAEGGRKLGLPADAARLLAEQTMLGTAAYLRQSGADLEAFISGVATPGGTTAAGMDVMRASDFADVVAQTLAAAANRSAELGRG